MRSFLPLDGFPCRGSNQRIRKRIERERESNMSTRITIFAEMRYQRTRSNAGKEIKSEGEEVSVCVRLYNCCGLSKHLNPNNDEDGTNHTETQSRFISYIHHFCINKLREENKEKKLTWVEYLNSRMNVFEFLIRQMNIYQIVSSSRWISLQRYKSENQKTERERERERVTWALESPFLQKEVPTNTIKRRERNKEWRRRSVCVCESVQLVNGKRCGLKKMVRVLWT